MELTARICTAHTPEPQASPEPSSHCRPSATSVESIRLPRSSATYADNPASSRVSSSQGPKVSRFEAMGIAGFLGVEGHRRQADKPAWIDTVNRADSAGHGQGIGPNRVQLERINGQNRCPAADGHRV